MGDWIKPFVVLHSDTGVDVVMLRGEIDHHEGVLRLEKTLATLGLRSGAKIILDFRDVTYCCSSGIALVLDASDKATESGGVVVCAAVCGAAREPMELLDIPGVVPFFESTADALEALEKGAVGAAAMD